MTTDKTVLVKDTPEHTIATLCARSHAISLEKGWVTAEGDPRSFATITALNHTELSEAFEEYRGNRGLTELFYEISFTFDGVKGREWVPAADIEAARKMEGKYGRGKNFVDAKPCGIPVELADFIIRVAQHVGTAGKGDQLDELVEARTEVPIYPDLDTLIAEVHLSVSLAYSAAKNEPGDAYLEHLSDALCEVLAFCDVNKINIWAAIDEKEAYNRTRPIRHGGKKV